MDSSGLGFPGPHWKPSMWSGCFMMWWHSYWLRGWSFLQDQMPSLKNSDFYGYEGKLHKNCTINYICFLGFLSIFNSDSHYIKKQSLFQRYPTWFFTFNLSDSMFLRYEIKYMDFVLKGSYIHLDFDLKATNNIGIWNIINPCHRIIQTMKKKIKQRSCAKYRGTPQQLKVTQSQLHLWVIKLYNQEATLTDS